MARILSIDYGKKRTGIAVTDPLQMIANGLTTVDTAQLFDFIADYLSKEQVERIVVGYPKQVNGEDSENMKRITPFVNRLRKLYPTITIELYDERLTSVLAHRAILDTAISRKARQDKAKYDKIRDTIILKDNIKNLKK